MKDLVPIENEKADAYSRILRFYEKADIVLTSEEEMILSRWVYCDALLRQRRFKTADIIDKIKEKYSVSVFTAQSDIKNTYALFAATRVLSKTYLLNEHIESIQLKITQAESDKSMAPILPKLYQELTRAIMALPEGGPKETTAAPTIIFGVVPGQEQGVSKLSFEEAKELLRQKRQQAAAEDIDYEDVKL